jgi:hypothetical protein
MILKINNTGQKRSKANSIPDRFSMRDWGSLTGMVPVKTSDLAGVQQIPAQT